MFGLKVFLKKWMFSFYQIIIYTYRAPKVYHHGEEKTKIKIGLELLSWLLHEKQFNIHYYSFGLNLKSRKQSSYIGRRKFLSIKTRAEKALKKKGASEEINHEILTKDKFYFGSVLAANDIPCVKNHALISNEKVFLYNGTYQELDYLLMLNGNYFIKNTILEAGDGVFLFSINNGDILLNGENFSFENLCKLFNHKKWILQEAHRSHKEIRKMNSTALNTTRIVTILKGNNPEFITGFQSFATKEEKIDSWSKGSIYVGLDVENNCLKKYGYFHPHVGIDSIVEEHPDSGVRFEGYKINELGNAVRLCIKTHMLFYYNFVIGWDVAITERGPMILEANEKPGMNAVQCIDGGLKKKILSYYLANLLF